MLGSHASIDIPQSTEYAKEMRKWESYPSKFGAPGRPYVFKAFSKALYRFKWESGKDIVLDEMFFVQSEDEQRNMESRGFHATQELAVAAIEAEHTEHGKLAAERNYEIQHGRISEKAAAEVRAAEAEHGATHLPSVPVKPVRKRRTKAEMAAARG